MSERNFPKLSKSPIQSAILEIRYSWADKAKDASSFADLTQYIKVDLPVAKKGEHQEISLNDETGQIKATTTSRYVREYKFFSESKRTVLLTSRNVFNLNVGDKYSNWEDLITKFKFYWESFSKQVVAPNDITITGVSARYINSILIENLDVPANYFNTTLYGVEGAIPETVIAYLTNYRSVNNEGFHIVVTQGIQPVDSTKKPYIFDIDVIKDGLSNESDIWDIFEKIRKIKNEVFFSNITDQTLVLLK